MVRAALCSLVLLCSVAASAQDVNVRVGGMGLNMGVHVDDPAGGANLSAESYRLDSVTNPEGATILKIVRPEGARVDVWSGKKMVHQDDIPTSFAATPDVFYRVVVRLPDGRVWEKKLQAKRRHTSTLAVLVPQAGFDRDDRDDDRDRGRRRHHHHDDRAAGPTGMSGADFAALKSAIAAEAFEEQKLAVLSTAAGSAWFTIAQVGELVDQFSFSSGKVKVVSITRPHLVDPQNAFQLYAHFTFDSDKQKVKQILGQ